jgi:hypothetical protein
MQKLVPDIALEISLQSKMLAPIGAVFDLIGAGIAPVPSSFNCRFTLSAPHLGIIYASNHTMWGSGSSAHARMVRA